MKTKSLLIPFILLGILSGFLVSCGSGGSFDSGPAANAALRIYLLSGQDGALTPTGQPNEYVLNINNADRTVFWYTDRPERESGQETLSNFIGTGWDGVYGSIPPNAIIQFDMPDGSVEAVFVTLDSPEYNADTGVLRFQVVLRNSTLTGGPGGGVSLGSPVMTVLNNVQGQSEASSFAQYADNVSLTATGTAGVYTLTLDNLDPEVFWMENAPGRYGDFELIGSFITNWIHRFGNVPPNASLAGTLNGDRLLLLMTLDNAGYDAGTGRATYSATLLGAPGANIGLEDITGGANMGVEGITDAVLYIDAGAGSIPSNPFPVKVHGIAYSPVPAMFSQAPPQNTQFFDSDLVNDNFTAIWGTDGTCGRNDLQTMSDAGIKFIRLYDYNYARGASSQGTYGKGHINFLNMAQSLGIKVIIPVSNWNFSNDQYAWENIDTTVTNIIESVKVNGEIHPAVHSFSVGNELDLDKYGMDYTVLIPRAIEVVKKINTLAPDHYITIPVSNWKQMDFFGWFKNGDGATISPVPSDIYNNRFYNSVQTFKQGADLKQNVLEAYDNDARFDGIPLAITELGTSVLDAGSEDAMFAGVINQAQTAQDYMVANSNTRFKGFFIFQWQNANWKGGAGVADSYYGVHNYDGSLCTSNTGPYDGNNPQAATDYSVDKLVQKTSSQYQDGLVDELAKIFQ